MAPSSAAQPISVLFVCLGNICRSPMGEGVFRSLVANPPYSDFVGRVDSCGTGAYHVGDQPDGRTLRTLEGHGVTGYVHVARKIQLNDFSTFDYIFAMDRQNLRDLKRQESRAKNAKAKVMLFGEWAGKEREGREAEEVDDPYYGGGDGFEKAYEQCVRFSKNFLEEVLKEVEA